MENKRDALKSAWKSFRPRGGAGAPPQNDANLPYNGGIDATEKSKKKRPAHQDHFLEASAFSFYGRPVAREFLRKNPSTGSAGCVKSTTIEKSLFSFPYPVPHQASIIPRRRPTNPSGKITNPACFNRVFHSMMREFSSVHMLRLSLCPISLNIKLCEPHELETVNIGNNNNMLRLIIG